MGALFVIPAPIGQLGNRLIHFAHLQAFAIEQRIPLIHPAFHPYADLFVGSQNSLLSICDPTRLFFSSPHIPLLQGLLDLYLQQVASTFLEKELLAFRKRLETGTFQELDASISPEFREIIFTFGFVLRSWVVGKSFSSVSAHYFGAGDDPFDLENYESLQNLIASSSHPDAAPTLILFDGWGFRAPKAFAKHKTQVLNYLMPIPTIQREIDALVGAAKEFGAKECRGDARKLLIGLHVRRGDYDQWRGGAYFFSWEQYRNIAQQILNHFGQANVALLVCASEPPPHDTFAGLPVLISKEQPLVDMYALAACDHIVGPPSTFTGWAQILSNVAFHYIGQDGRVVFS